MNIHKNGEDVGVGKRNILLTTMSISNYKGDYRVYYYYVKNENGEKKYCNGISALEPGTKYFLSKYPINEVVAIGTDKTIKQTDTRIVENLNNTWVMENQEYSSHTISPYELYKYRIADFLKNEQAGLEESTEKDIVKKINQDRQREIEAILKWTIYKELLGEHPDRFFEIESKLKSLFQEVNEDFWKCVKSSIEEDIRKNFENSTEYGKYVAGKKDLEQYEKGIQEKEDIARQYEKRRQEICSDSKLSLFEREYLLMSLKSKIKESLLSIKVHTMEKEILELQKENARLEYEITILKNHRKDSEFAYAQYYAYKNLDQKYRLLPLKENISSAKGIKVTFVDEQVVDGSQKVSYDNITGIVNALYGNGDDEINLYIDMQGGNRTSGYVRNAVLSILNNQDSERIHICEIVGTNFLSWALEGSEIIDETVRYKITDLVSGMNAFIRYGKADMIQSYCESMKIVKDSSVGKLVEYMVGIDESISLCNTAELVESIQGLRTFFKEEQVEGNSAVENIFEILKDGIKRDYGKLLSEENAEEIDFLELIAWCNRKGFVQQALTLIEDKMPKVYFDSGILNYEFIDGEEKKQDFINNVKPEYEKRVENLIFNSLKMKKEIDHSFDVLWQLEDKKKRKKLFLRANEENLFLKGKRAYIQTVMGSKWFEKKIKKETLVILAEEIKQIASDEKFVKQYCKFRRLEADYEKDGLYSAFNDENIYEQIVSKIKDPDENMYFSILNCLGEKKYLVEDNSKRNEKGKKKEKNSEYKKIEVWIRLQSLPVLEPYKDKLEQIFLLHEALKAERNSSNHASEKGVRIPYKVVTRAINIYTYMLKDIMEICRKEKDA